MPDWILPDWMTMPEWIEPKLLVLFVLIGTVLFLSRRRGDRPAAERVNRESRIAAMLKHGKR
jgi:hypothetical protein